MLSLKYYKIQFLHQLSKTTYTVHINFYYIQNNTERRFVNEQIIIIKKKHYSDKIYNVFTLNVLYIYFVSLNIIRTK